MTDLEVFQFPATGQEIRTCLRDGEPWFVGRDACAVLAIAKPENSLALLDADEKDTHTVGTPGGAQVMTVISESGLYSLILRSRRPEAKAFKRWVTHDVLPALRKTGRYEIGSVELDELEVARRYVKAIEEKRALQVVNAQQAKELTSARPKAEYVDSFVSPSGDLATIRAFAGQVGLTEKQLRDYLVARKVICRRTVGERWSASKGRKVPEYQWLARSKYVTWFTSRDQPEAPRLHNGQTASTLYVNPVGKVAIADLLRRHPADGQKAVATATPRVPKQRS